MAVAHDTDRPWRILLVDDNELDRAEAKAALLCGHHRHYQFVEATSANEAMHLCASSTPFDCMILDFFLPDGDALDVLARLPCDADKIPHLPVVILTGVAGTASRASLRHGAQDFVGKAWLGRESLTWAVENAIERRKIAREVMAERHVMDSQRQYLFEAERTARLESERVALLKDEFLATLSHELRTPLAVIVGWAGVLQRAQDNPDTVRRGVDVIARNAGLQAKLINDLLDMNRIVTGKLILDLQRVDLGALLDSAGEFLRPLAIAKGVDIRIDIRDGAPLELDGDAVRLQQIFANLLGNALKFTPGGGAIVLTARRRDDGQVAVTVRDDGEGIDARFLPQLFTRFSQENSKAARVHGGLGIGLSIVRQLTELHGGTVSGASAGVGKGATFTVLLPLRSIDVVREGAGDDTAGIVMDADAHQLMLIDLRGVSVLLVDDNEDILELSRRVLEERGAGVVAVNSVEAALAQLRDALPQVLVSDISMPTLTGYDLIRTVRNDLRLDAQKLPAVSMSAFARPLDQQRALQAGYQAYLIKPLQPHLLIRAVAQLVGRGEVSPLVPALQRH
ncbi:signal transduction histidine kinase [Massilia sp. MP_M2]|uniref:ATP-binding response regulator n=1 Tax=Massilia sp. MP_M2 TaxID=3071713 RepID=UPI00319EBB58